jgi:hypothetical protein
MQKNYESWKGRGPARHHQSKSGLKEFIDNGKQARSRRRIGIIVGTGEKRINSQQGTR